jgi:hypothetical protein
MLHNYYSQRTSKNPNLKGLPLEDVIELFNEFISSLRMSSISVKHSDFGVLMPTMSLERFMMSSLRCFSRLEKKYLWPVSEFCKS